jgi:DNA invertase Pin-like site-specific DNA recombinase
MPMFGYARVSTRDQDFNAQVAELMAAGCAKVYREKASGAKTDRAELAKVMSRMEPGDVLVVCRLDRLARSTRDLLNIIEALTQRGAGFKSLKDTWADTTSPHGRLMLTVLGGLAEFERKLIRARTGDGRKRAKERGVRFGRPRKLTPHQRQEALARLEAGETQADVARTYNVDATSAGYARELVLSVSVGRPHSRRSHVACHRPLRRSRWVEAAFGAVLQHDRPALD